MTRLTRQRVLLIDMGGTISEGPFTPRSPMGRIDVGGSARFVSASRSAALRRIADYDSLFASDEGSPDIDPRLWTDLAKLIDEHQARYSGFVITHGTDTLAWAAAALSFALCGFPGSVVLTGAMRPLTDEGSDGWPNLVHAFQVASRRLISGISVVFGSRILHGCRARKLSYRPADAFDSPAVPALARIGKTIRMAQRRIRPPSALAMIDGARRFRFDPDVAFVPICPGLSDTAFAQLGWSRGVVVETYLSGTIPRRLLPALEALAADRPVVVTTENGRLTAPVWPRYPAFLISGRDMTREAAVVKLMWALGHSSDRESVRHVMTSDIVGEVSAGA